MTGFRTSMAVLMVSRIEYGMIGLVGDSVAAVLVGPHGIECHGKNEAGDPGRPLWPVTKPSSRWIGSLLIQLTPRCDADQP